MESNIKGSMLLLIGAALLFCFPAAAQDATAGQNPLVSGGYTGPITYDINTRILTISNTADVSQGMVGCSQYNGNGQCQGSPQTFYHTATGTVDVQNLTKGTSASNHDVQTGAIMNASVSIAADPGDVLSISETQTIYCPMVGQNVVAISGLIDLEAAFTNVYWNGPTPACYTNILGGVRCLYLVHNNCTAATTPPDFSLEGKLLDDTAQPASYRSWIAFAICIRPATGGTWLCTHGGAANASLNVPYPPYSCTHHP